jgi:micrococcal nuclease
VRSEQRYGRGGWLVSAVLLVLVAVIFLRDDPGQPGPAPGGGADPPRAALARVLRVIDGDTIEVVLRGRSEDVRYIGIDTPETVKPGTPVQCFGPRAHELNQRLVGGRSVRLVFDAERRDVYQRLLAYVYTGGRFVNAVLVRRGYARTLTIPPNDSHAGLFHRLARRAGRAGRGLWAAC